MELRHGEEIRRLPLENFFLDYGKQDRKPGEFVRRLLVPKLPPATDFRAYKITKRLDEDISAVLAAFCLKVDGGRISDAGSRSAEWRASRNAQRPSKRNCAG